MKASGFLRFFVLGAMIVSLVSACGNPQNLAQPTDQVAPTETGAEARTPAALSLPDDSPADRPQVTTAPTQTASPITPSLPGVTSEAPESTALPENVGPAISPENAAGLTLIKIWGTGSPQGLDWSADGSRLFVGSQAGIQVFDANTGGQVLRLPAAGWLTGMDISPDGQTLAVLHSNQTLDFYDLPSGKLVSSLPDATPNRPVSLQYIPDGSALLVGLHDGLVSLLAVDDQDVTISLFGDFGHPVDNLAIASEPLRLVGPNNDLGLAAWQIEDPENPQFLYNLAGTPDTGPFLCAAFSRDGRWLAASTWDGLLFVWDMGGEDATQEFQTLWPTLDGFSLPAAWTALSFSTDGHTLASGGDNGDLWLWDLESAQSTLAAHSGQSPISLLAYSPDGQALAAAFSDGQTALVDSSNLEVKHSLSTGPAWGGSLAAISDDGRFLTTSTQAYLGDGQMMRRTIDGDGLYLRSYPGGEILRKMDTSAFSVPPSGFTALALSPDGRWLAASPLGLPLAVWDAGSGEMAYIFDDPDTGITTCNRVLFSPDGVWIARACYGSQVSLWRAASGADEQELQTGLREAITALDFSPDGNWLAIAGRSGPVYLLNLAENRVVRTLEFFDPAPITSLSFSPDGRYLTCSTGRDMPQVVIWELASGDQVAALGFNDTVATTDISPDGRLLAVGIDFEFFDVLEIWDWKAQELLLYERYDTDLTQVFFSPDGRLVTTVSQDGLLRIWGLTPRD